MVFILTSSEDILEVAVRTQEARQNDPAISANLMLKIKSQVANEVFIEQNTYICKAAEAFYSSINKLDKRTRFKASVNLINHTGEGINLAQGSSSSGLGYTLALFNAFWLQSLKKEKGFDAPVFATGEILSNGEIRPVDFADEKARAIIPFCKQHSITDFYLCIPENCKLADNIEKNITQAGGTVIYASRLQGVLAALLGQHYDGDPLGRWEPFKGFASFENEDSLRFFGRDADVHKLADDLEHCDGVLVVSGASGAGKSSLVNAGLIPYLEKQQESFSWKIATPKELPFNNVSSVLAAIDLDCGLCLLHLDQVEELLFYPNKQLAAKALTELISLTKRYKNLKLILTVKSENLANLLELGEFNNPVVSHVTNQLPISAWEEIIVKQAHFSGIELESGLLDQLVADAMQLTNGLPILEFVLQQLYLSLGSDNNSSKVLQIKHYNEMGGLHGAIATQIEKVVLANKVQQANLNQLFALFVGLTSYNKPYAELVQLDYEYEQPQELSQLIDILANKGFIFKYENNGQTYYKFAYDSLFECWPFIKRWIVEHTEFLKWKLLVAANYHEWQKLESESRYHYLINNKKLLREGTGYLEEGLIPSSKMKAFIKESEQQQGYVKTILAALILFLGIVVASMIPSFTYNPPSIEINTLTCETGSQITEGIQELVIYVSNYRQANQLKEKLCEGESQVAKEVFENYQRVKFYWQTTDGYAPGKLFSGEIAIMPSAQTSLDVGAIIKNEGLYTPIAKNEDYYSCFIAANKNPAPELSASYFANKKIGLVNKYYSQSGYQTPFLELLSHGVSPEQITYYPNHTELREAVKNLEIDIAGSYCPESKEKFNFVRMSNIEVGFSWYIANNMKVNGLKCFFQEFLIKQVKNSGREYFRNIQMINMEECQ